MKIKLFSMFAVLTAALTLVGCQKEADSLEISSAKISATAFGEEQTLSFTTNNDWTIKSDSEWVSVSPESGLAGTASVKVNILSNDTFNTRTATITLTSGTKTSTWKVEQDFVKVFSAASEINIDSKAQALSVKVNTNETFQATSDCDWLTVVSTKAAPSDKTVSLSVKANAGFDARTAVVKVVSASGSNYSFSVNQSASESAAKLESIYYLGNVNNPVYYDGYNTVPSQTKEYALVLSTQKGKLVLALNSVNGELAGSYEVDAAADHTAGTFSIKPVEGFAKYYTTIFEGDKEIIVADGLVSVETSDNNIVISAQLSDDKENIYEFTYNGAKAETIAADKGAKGSADYGGDYFTHFAKGQKKYNVSLNPSTFSEEGCPALYSTSFEIYADKSYDGKSLPIGTFTILPEDECMTIANTPYANGNYSYTDNTSVAYEYNYGDFDADKYAEHIKKVEEDPDYDYSISYYTQYVQKSGTITISKGSAAGCYNFVINAVYVSMSYDADYNPVYGEDKTYSQTFENVYVPISDNHQEPTEDGDKVFAFANVSSDYSGHWLGDTYKNGSNVFFFGWTNVIGAYSVSLALQTTKSYEFVKNFNNRFCNTNIPDGTYSWSEKSPNDAEGKALDCLCNTTSATWRCITNTYTGTKAYISGGSITFSNGNVSFDLTAKTADGKEFHYTGGFATKCFYAQDRSANATYQKNAVWNPNI